MGTIPPTGCATTLKMCKHTIMYTNIWYISSFGTYRNNIDEILLELSRIIWNFKMLIIVFSVRWSKSDYWIPRATQNSPKCLFCCIVAHTWNTGCSLFSLLYKMCLHCGEIWRLDKSSQGTSEPITPANTYIPRWHHEMFILVSVLSEIQGE